MTNQTPPNPDEHECPGCLSSSIVAPPHTYGKYCLQSAPTNDTWKRTGNNGDTGTADFPVVNTNDSELDEILLQFIAEYHQGLNELAGHGTATEQARGALLAWRQEAVDGALAHAATPTAHNEQVDELVRDIMKVPYSKHKAKARLLQWRQEAIDELREYDNLLTVRAIDGAQENCNAVPDDQPNDVHIRFFNQGYKKGVDTSLRELLERLPVKEIVTKYHGVKSAHQQSRNNTIAECKAVIEAAIKKNGGEL